MSLVSGPIFQICCVVDDMDASVEWFTGHLGVPRWMRMDGIHFGPETCTYRDAPADFFIDLAIGYSGEQQVELIRPVSGQSIYADYLATHGPGVHHIAYSIDDFDATVASARERGLAISQSGSLGGMRFAYVDGTSVGAPYVELMTMPPEMHAMFATLKDEPSSP